MKDEIRTIPGYCGYTVSNKGIFTSKDKFSNTTPPRLIKGSEISTRGFLDGYPAVNLRNDKNTGRFNIPIHKILAQTFLPNASEDFICHHINCNKLDYSLDNLICLTRFQHKTLHLMLKIAKNKSSFYGFTKEGRFSNGKVQYQRTKPYQIHIKIPNSRGTDRTRFATKEQAAHYLNKKIVEFGYDNIPLPEGACEKLNISKLCYPFIKDQFGVNY